MAPRPVLLALLASAALGLAQGLPDAVVPEEALAAGDECSWAGASGEEAGCALSALQRRKLQLQAAADSSAASSANASSGEGDLQPGTWRTSGVCPNIINIDDCRRVAERLQVPFSRTHCQEPYCAPKGCYQYRSYDNANNLHVYWNSDKFGECSESRQCLCMDLYFDYNNGQVYGYVPETPDLIPRAEPAVQDPSWGYEYPYGYLGDAAPAGDAAKPEASAAPESAPPVPDATASGQEQEAAAACSANSACAALGLDGLCCPNAEGIRLGCCGTKEAEGEVTDEPSAASTQPSEAPHNLTVASHHRRRHGHHHHYQPSGGQSGSHHGQIVTVYHQTSQRAGQSILRTGFRSGTHGICGGGIYFATNPKLTDIKSVGGYGYMIEARVDLGRVKFMSKTCDSHMTGAKLSSMGYDSIRLDRSHWQECKHIEPCQEVVVYDKSRVVSMKGFPWMWANAWGVQRD